MRRQLLIMTLALALAGACGAALAQTGALAGVTMRVVDDVTGLDVVIIEIEPEA